MRNFAFIFARGGSKGLPGKNIKPLAGKPLLQYSIDTALASDLIEQVFVSTDDQAIAQVAIEGGAILIERPAELATDQSPEWLSWRHAVEWATEHYGSFDGFVSLPATSPLRSQEDVEAAILKRQAETADICIAVTPASRSPYFNMVKYNEAGFVELVNQPEGEVSRRQDAPKVFDITTVVYATTPEFVLNSYGLFSGKVASIEVPKARAVDIDDIYDFRLAEAIIKGE
ncbi:acylneuraminate cytidylyltransferase family protein [Acinetobacter baumannii]|uniref:acylneuraminate cytidylyltransferase family protein n=1 Tax=Acinetobacter TaxID=469 RepID=UPI0002AED81B|nr:MULTISPECIES: acylneuraminate cytidylyltransferase family protein [Acinetobacter calcoaceticus/baumannii complex]AIY39056.1 MobA-like NTP transferase domain protein [Acinetobacter baumannii LAC-4]AKQ32287.1 acylneuraminate cytidylyltransferase [Acinetobacter baumannii]AML65296.1 acylneuraminate cytidylyltransferase [Acinetobacter baumannii]AOX71843.1 CMP-N,N'-diacetyllegionaminic acid synthase [Acinetobacter baumannii]AOX83519.1 MobA-like NTP transferase domain protein [Acinetobacter bauman